MQDETTQNRARAASVADANGCAPRRSVLALGGTTRTYELRYLFLA